MAMSKLYISDTKLSEQKPYIYCICIKNPTALVYIGQTSQKRGALGRFMQHIRTDGTLMKQVKAIGIVDIADVFVAAKDLTEYNIFEGVYSIPRNSLELLVQSTMKAKGCSSVIPFEVISTVANSSQIHDFEIQKIASDVTEMLCSEIPFFDNKQNGWECSNGLL